ncbi:MAG: hypothetical protein K6D97_01965 [Clostridia bacterium]|nr:hypothetical protein [Clostridia bacterium]
MKKGKVKRIESDKFKKPDNIEDIEVIIGDTSVINISEVGDYISTVKPEPTGTKNASIIIPREKLTEKQKEDKKSSNELRIPKNVKKGTAKKEMEKKSNHTIKVMQKTKITPADTNPNKVTAIESLEKAEVPKKKVKINPETGEPIKKKKVKIDPNTGKPIKKKVKIDPETGKSIKKKKIKIDPETGKPIKMKKPIE